VRFAYAGESTTERMRVVKDEGREASERVKGVVVVSGLGVALVGGAGTADGGGEDLARSSSRLSLPMPMFS